MPRLRRLAASLRRRFCLQLTATLELSATVEKHPTSHISYLISHIVRRQLFDDIMKRNCGVMGIFSDRRRFPKNAYFSQNSTAFPKMRTFPKATRLSRKCVVFRMRAVVLCEFRGDRS
jgi:hypothetical protein